MQTKFKLAAAVFVLAAAITAHAAAYAAAPKAGDHYQAYKGQSCSDNISCKITFGKIPSGKSVLVTNVSCSLEGITTSTAGIFSMTLSDDLDGFNTTLTPVQVGAIPSGHNFYMLSNNVTSHLLDGGRKPLAIVGFNENFSSVNFLCGISGTWQ
jgi:hypothetical protein